MSLVKLNIHCAYYYYVLTGEIPDLPTLDTSQLSDLVLKPGEYFTSAIASIKQVTKQDLVVEDQPCAHTSWWHTRVGVV